jgi:FlaA1/EpsC-like NDP-sugar epimerase
LKKKNILAAAFTIVLMFTSVALFDRSQVIPQGIDMILFPLAILFFLEKKKLPFIALMLIMIYSHGYFSLLLLLGLTLFSFREKINRGFIIITAIFSLPLILFFLPYLPGYISSRLEGTALIMEKPLFLIGYFGLQLALFLPLALVYCFIERKNFDALDKISIYWLLATLFMAFMFSL